MAAHFKEWPGKPENLVLEEKEKGHGSYGRVYIGKLAGNPVAVKVIYPNLLRAPGNDHLLLGFKEECAKLKSLKHDRIVKLLGTFWDRSLGPLLVMEVLDQNLEEFLRDHSKPGSLPLMQQLEIVKEVTEGLRYLHTHNIVHRDLKPANILIGKDGHLRIGDLGQSKLLNSLSDIMKTMQPGTPLYLPPEALRKGSAYTLKIDVFSLGVVTLCIATRQAAPTTDIMNIGSVPEIIRRKEDLDRLEEEHPLKGVISACLQDDPNLRPDVCFIDDHLGVLVVNGRLDSTVNKLEEALTGQRKELMALNKLYNLQKKELADSNSKFKAQESRCQSHVQTIERQAKELNAQKLTLDEEQRQGEEMLQRASTLEATLKACEDKCQRHICTIERQARVLSAQKKSLDVEREAKQLQQKEMLERIVNLETKLKMKHVEYEKGVVCIEETLVNQRQELDELSKWSTKAFDKNTVLEREVRELRKRLTSAKSELEAEVMEHATKIQQLQGSDHEREPFCQKAVTNEEMSCDRRSLFKSKVTLKDEEVYCERSSLILVKDGREYSKPADCNNYFRKRGFRVELVGIRKPANESSKDLIVEVEAISKEEVDMSNELKSQASIMINETTTTTLSGPYLPQIIRLIPVLMENDPFLMGRGLHVDDSTTDTEIDNIEDDLEQGSVKVSGPARLVMYLRKLIHQTLVQYIAVMDSPQGKSIFEIAYAVAEESDGPDGGSDLDQSVFTSKWEGEGFHHSRIISHHKSNVGTCVDDPPYGISVAVQTGTTTPEASILTGKKSFKGNKSEAIPKGNVSRGFHPEASTYRQISNVGTSVDDTSVAAQTDTTPKAMVLTGKESSKGAVPEATSKEPDVVEIPLDKTHRRLVVKKGYFLYEDADIKILAICSEMGFTKGLNKNLNDQLKGLLMQTVNRRYQNKKPDKFDVFIIHCAPSTIGCRYLVIANILDRTLGSRQDHHKFLQQILHCVFKEADTLEMPTVAISMLSFTIGGFPMDTILPSFVRTLNQYQFTNDEFFCDVRVLATSAENFSYLVAVTGRFLGRSLTSRRSKKTASDLPNSKDDKVRLSPQEIMNNGERRVVPPLAYASNLDPAVIHLMIKCQMINQFLTISSDFTRVDVLKGAERYLEDFSTSYQKLLNGQRIIQESVKLRETLFHNTLALLVSTLEAQFPQAIFDFDVGKNSVCFLSLDQSILEAVDKTVQDFLSKKRTIPKEHPHTNGATEQPTIILSMPYNRALTVKKGDLVKEEVTAIVNAANEWLKHAAGVAYAINQASRGQVQRESDQLIRGNRQHPIPTGQVAITGAGGDLRCKAVIHAVGPDASVMKADDCKQLLKQACENTLRCAEDEGMHSIALPPISSGIYAMPKDLVAQILIDTILQYPYRQDSSLKDIRIVIIDRLTFLPFLQYAQQVADSSTTHK